ncbi:hypothetical protein [Sphingomonas sp. Leaf37]|uniref:hypothetical protein n=1 Tax=Sphingomonas sp. Leaf37 TaxID=2876552 RepID=UPI001E59D41F|nr:hypothetical protein [Sphingomonas sp. Leaf37]
MRINNGTGVCRSFAQVIMIGLTVPSAVQAEDQIRTPATGQAQSAKGGGTTNALPGCGVGGGEPETPPGPPPPVKSAFASSPGGVDMRSGSYSFENEDLSIGSGGDALSLKRVFSFDGWDGNVHQRFGKFFNHNWSIMVRERRVPVGGACYPSQFDYNVTVDFGALSEGFRSRYQPIAFEQTAAKAGYAELAASGGYTFTARDGTRVVFPAVSGGAGCGTWMEACAYAESVTQPDGTVFTLSYESGGSQGKLRSVVSNRGFALLFEYGGGEFVTKACVINLAVAPKPTDNSCPIGAVTATYGYAGDVQTVAAMPAGGSWSFAQPSANSFSLTRPGESAPFVINSYDLYSADYPQRSLAVTHQALAGGTSYSYQWDLLENTGGDGSYTAEVTGGKLTDSAGGTVEVRYGMYTKQQWDQMAPPYYYATPGPVMVKDQLGRVTSADYCDTTATSGHCPYLQIPPLKRTSNPEGDTEEYVYTSYRNLYRTTRIAKPGTNLANLIETRDYGGTTPATRSKPTAITDSRSNVTNFSYDPTHGGLLYEQGPADSNGIRPVKWRHYVQRSAWLSNGGGGFYAAPPVWVMDYEGTCRTTATNLSDGNCGGGAADRTVTTYDYGPDNGSAGNNLLVRGVTVTADGQSRRTCYGYDGQGRRIWETSPRAGLGACY